MPNRLPLIMSISDLRNTSTSLSALGSFITRLPAAKPRYPHLVMDRGVVGQRTGLFARGVGRWEDTVGFDKTECDGDGQLYRELELNQVTTSVEGYG